MTNQPAYLDLDAIDTEVTLVIKLKGTEHKLVPITVDDFIANMATIEKMGTSGDVKAETELLIEMLSRSFPTIGKPVLWKLTLPQLNAIMAEAQKYSGQGAVTEEIRAKLAAEGNENPPIPKS